MAYYRGNELCDELDKLGAENLVWPGRDRWWMAYFDRAGELRLLILLSRVEDKNLFDISTVAEARSARAIHGIAKRLNTSFGQVRFSEHNGSLRRVVVMEGGAIHAIGTPKDIFGKAGFKAGVAQHSVNRTVASAFQQWQRANVDCIATDLDLMRLANAQPEELIEIKRSTVPDWSPYKNDQSALFALEGVARSAGLRFSIVFLPQDQSRIADVNRLSIFTLVDGRPYRFAEKLTLLDFRSGSYLSSKNWVPSDWHR
jgi:hypothetical protein